MLYDRALKRFIFALAHNRNSIFDFHLKKFDDSKVTEELYWKIVKAIETLNVEVLLKHDIGTWLDVKNKLFNIAGMWEQNKQQVYLSSFSYIVLAHEYAHVVDSRILNKNVYGVECEIVASAASYIFVCERMGPFSPRVGVKYIKRYGVNIKALKPLKQRIVDVFWNMHYLAR